MYWIGEDKLITPSWYNQLMYDIKIKFNKQISYERSEQIRDEDIGCEEIRKGVEKLVRLYIGENIEFY